MTEPLLELKGLSAGYPGHPVLRDVTFRVEPNQIWAVLGPNGSGKSTLARVAMGLLPASAGSVTLAGRRLPAPPSWVARQVGWVPQQLADDTGFTVLELVLMGRLPTLGWWGLTGQADEIRARKALAEVDASHLAAQRLDTLSGGERRRVYLARALVQAPKLLVLDEATAFLDIRHQASALARIAAYRSTSSAVVAVLHDFYAASRLATHALLLREGVVVAQGPVAEVLREDLLSQTFDVPLRRAEAGEAFFVPR